MGRGFDESFGSTGDVACPCPYGGGLTSYRATFV
jgi:hypothetical protein